MMCRARQLCKTTALQATISMAAAILRGVRVIMAMAQYTMFENYSSAMASDGGERLRIFYPSTCLNEKKFFSDAFFSWNEGSFNRISNFDNPILSHNDLKHEYGSRGYYATKDEFLAYKIISR